MSEQEKVEVPVLPPACPGPDCQGCQAGWVNIEMRNGSSAMVLMSNHCASYFVHLWLGRLRSRWWQRVMRCWWRLLCRVIFPGEYIPQFVFVSDTGTAIDLTEVVAVYPHPRRYDPPAAPPEKDPTLTIMAANLEINKCNMLLQERMVITQERMVNLQEEEVKRRREGDEWRGSGDRDA